MEPAVAPPPEAPRSSPPHLAVVLAAGFALVGVVALIYRDAALSYFLNDDFQWLQGARSFSLVNIFHIERYNHFYRPVIEAYFYLGRTVFGCAAFPFHVASIAIHLINSLLLYLFARTLTRSDAFAALAAVFFAVQPGHAQAVAWVGAITDLLPATWFLLAMWAHLLFLQRRHARFYLLSLVAFALCLLTHESSATLLPMMAALEAAVMWENGEPLDLRALGARVARYLPFALMLGGYLALAYVVNSRSYLVREGHYQFGWHAVPHIIRYLITLYVGTRDVPSQVALVAVLIALLARGTPRVRFLTLWMLLTLAPASFFTWENVSRYLYLPAAGFSMLLAAGLLAACRVATLRVSRRAARTALVAVATIIAVRFALFAVKVPAGFRASTRPYERLAEAVRKARAADGSSSTVYVTPADVEGVPDLYRDPAAEVATCGPDLHVEVR